LLSVISNSVNAGLPNITGAYTPFGGNNTCRGFNSSTSVSGALGKTKLGSYKTMAQTDGSFDAYRIDFNAKNSNSLFSKSDTVTPLSQKTNFAIKY